MNTNNTIDPKTLCVAKYEKATVDYLGGSRVRYTWHCGHQRNETVMTGPKGRGSRGMRKPMSPELVERFARYWGRRSDGTVHYGHSAGPCPTCVRIARQIDPRLVSHLSRNPITRRY